MLKKKKRRPTAIQARTKRGRLRNNKINPTFIEGMNLWIIKEIPVIPPVAKL